MYRVAALILAVLLAQLGSAAELDEIKVDRYLGTYPCAGHDAFFFEPAVAGALKAALGNSHERYEQHRALSGCGPITRFENYLFIDISQLHVGGYTSMILFDPKTDEAYIFWLESPVKKWTAHTYGKRPIPPMVLTKFASEMNIGWGHVASFGVRDGDLAIVDEAKQRRIN